VYIYTILLPSDSLKVTGVTAET